MFGKVTSAEYDQIKAQGWDVMRRPLIREVDKFCDPSCVESNEKDQDAEDFFVLVWVDSGIAENLTK